MSASAEGSFIVLSLPIQTGKPHTITSPRGERSCPEFTKHCLYSLIYCLAPRCPSHKATKQGKTAKNTLLWHTPPDLADFGSRLLVCVCVKKQDKAQLELPREPQSRIGAGFTALHPAHKSAEGNFKPSPGSPGQPQAAPQSLVPCSCPATDFPHPIPFVPTATTPPVSLCAVPSVPSVSDVPAVITRSKRFFPLHIFLFFSVRCGKPDRMITQHVPCACCLLGSHSRNDKWEREEFRKHQKAQKAAGQIESNPAVVLLVRDRAAKPRDKYSDVPLVCQQAIGNKIF